MGNKNFRSQEAFKKPEIPTTQSIIHRDGRPVPPVFALEENRFLGDEDISFDRYTSRSFFAEEMEKVWGRVWQWACREEHIPEPGDYYVYEIGHYSVLIVRDEDNAINAFVNSCLHRGTKLRPCGPGSSPDLRCPFHGWTWSLDGELKRVPSAWDVPHIADRDFSLPRVKVDTWGGFVFVNLDPDAGPLLDYLDPLPEHFANFDMENRYIELHIEKELPCNWKAAKEAFIENYHTQETHPQLLAGSYDEGTQYDVFNDRVSRFFCPMGVSSPHLPEPLTEQELLDLMLVGDREKLDANLEIGEGESARIVMARVLRETLAKAYRADLSRYTDTEIIDLSQYGLFPNMILYPQLTLPLIYRYRPIGNDPDRSLFEMVMLRPCPEGEERPEPAEPYRLKEEDSYTMVPGFDKTLGHVFDQDTDNLRAQQEGFYAARKKGETLLNYQEVRVRLLEQTIDKYLSA